MATRTAQSAYGHGTGRRFTPVLRGDGHHRRADLDGRNFTVRVHGSDGRIATRPRYVLVGGVGRSNGRRQSFGTTHYE